FGDMQVPRLTDDGDERRLRVEQRLQAGIVGRRGVLSTGHAERRDFRVLERKLADFLKVLEVLRVRERVAALDEIDAEFVELARDQQLVFEREVPPLALAAVAERRVVNENAGHAVTWLVSGEW